MARTHLITNLLGVQVRPKEGYEPGPILNVWKGGRNLQDQYIATVRSVWREDKETWFLVADPSGTLFEVSSNWVQVLEG